MCLVRVATQTTGIWFRLPYKRRVVLNVAGMPVGWTCFLSLKLYPRPRLMLPAPVTMFLEKRPSAVFRPSSILPRSLRGHFFGLLFLATIAFFFRYNYSKYPSTSTPDDPDYLLYFLRGLPKPEGGTNPPRFYEWHDREKRLPQHDINLPYPQGREGRYIRFTNQVWGTSKINIVFFRGCGPAAVPSPI